MAQWHPVVYCSGLHERLTCCVQYSKCLPLQELSPCMYWARSSNSQEQGQESAHLGTGASYFYFYFYSFLYISDWLTIYDRVAPTKNTHDLPGQWPVKLRRTWLFLHQSPEN